MVCQLIERTPEELRKLHQDAHGTDWCCGGRRRWARHSAGLPRGQIRRRRLLRQCFRPAKRHQIEFRLKWTTAQREETLRQGLTLETARRIRRWVKSSTR